MRVRVLNQMQWNIELIQLLCSAEWRTAVFIPGQEINTNTVCGHWSWFHIPHWQRPDQLCFCCSFCVCVCAVHMCGKTDRRTSLRGCVRIRQGRVRVQRFTARPYTCITHLAEGYSSRFKVSSNISLSEMQLKKPQNTPITVRTNRFSMPSDVRPINWENEHDWGPVSTRAGKGQTGW